VAKRIWEKARKEGPSNDDALGMLVSAPEQKNASRVTSSAATRSFEKKAVIAVLFCMKKSGPFSLHCRNFGIFGPQGTKPLRAQCACVGRCNLLILSYFVFWGCCLMIGIFSIRQTGGSHDTGESKARSVSGICEDMRIPRDRVTNHRRPHPGRFKDFVGVWSITRTAEADDLRSYQLHMADTGVTPSTFQRP